MSIDQGSVRGRANGAGVRVRGWMLAAVWPLAVAAGACGDDAGEGTPPSADSGAIDGAATGDGGTGDAGGDSGAGADPLALTGPEVSVETGLGTVVGGLEEGDTNVFLGIPYAEPPVGELRFAPPQPVGAWSSPRMARRYGSVCSQASASVGGFPDAQKSEDCLTLNVFAPAEADGLPVMVFIHGGAFVSGGSASEGYDGKLLTRQGVVLVTLNYRVGSLGFLSHPALDEARGDVPSGNDGLLDQRVALQWVRDHIADFGGDANNVTVFGESAGAASVCAHLVSPGSAGLADRYLMESGVCTTGLPPVSKVDADAVGERLVAALCEGESDVVACLRALDWQTLVAWGADEGISGAGWGPVVDAKGDMLPESPTAVVAEGRTNPGEVLLGSNVNEWALFTLFSLADVVRSEEEFDAAIAALPVPADVAQVRALYPIADGAEGNAVNEVSVQMVTDVVFRCPARAFARMRSAAGQTTYLYHFVYGGAMHASELSYVFGNPNPLLAPAFSEDLSRTVQSYWARFAATGDPNGGDAPQWPAYTADNDTHLSFDTEVTSGTGLREETCDFWDAQLAALAAGASQD